jgi:hypothetical protein
MRRSVVLQLLAGLKVVTAGRHDWRLPDSMPAAEGGKRLVGHGRSAGRQLFMDPDQIPFAFLQQLEDLLAVGFGYLWTLQRRHF